MQNTTIASAQVLAYISHLFSSAKPKLKDVTGKEIVFPVYLKRKCSDYLKIISQYQAEFLTDTTEEKESHLVTSKEQLIVVDHLICNSYGQFGYQLITEAEYEQHQLFITNSSTAN
ncbi:hypothetical protein [Adhaeribacter aquaticus]|uniref:hypothetical protein n=1 Tax=Adhaeribacter aquaticus TaxID=299567 RepID=UPI0003F95885|nr:hypothetical protein [Adhaeribacter aquaticus]